MTPVLRVTGTTDPDEIAAVIAAMAARRPQHERPPHDGQAPYERWRRGRRAALRSSRRTTE